MPIDHVTLPVSDLDASRRAAPATECPASAQDASADSGRAKIPGERPYGGFYYAAFVRDPDGHNVQAVYHGPVSRREPAR